MGFREYNNRRQNEEKDRGYRSPNDNLSHDRRLEKLNNIERNRVTEDFEDSPFSDRK